MKLRLWPVAVVTGLITSVLVVPVSSAAPSAQASGTAIAAGGTGAAAARAVQARGVAGLVAPPAGPDHVTLGQNGRPVNEGLPAAGPRVAKPAPSAARKAAGGPNTVAAPRPLTPPGTTNANFNGIDQTAGGGAQPSDVNAASGATQIVETVNRRFTVYNKTGGQQCTNTLAGFLGATEDVFDPRVQYDNVNDRFSMVVTLTPTSGTAAPALYVAASQTGNACGGWWVYRLTFNGSLYPAGTLLDYPQLGQDRVALLLSTNNFHPGYINSTAFSISKAQVYSGASVSFPAFSVSFTTQPATVGGNPIPATANSYFLASVAGTGYRLYRMTNSAGPGTTLTLQATVSSTFSAPPRQVNQPGTTTKLDPLDGRIVWSPYQVGNFIWFTHGIAIGSFPGIRYGAIRLSDNAPFVALAYRSGTSDDFNPSIGVSDAGGGGASNYIWLNWAYTDTNANVATSVTVDGVLPGGGVPNLIGTGTVLVNGAATSTNTRFGDYSSVSVENTCTAVIAQQFFNTGGNWNTRIGRLSFC
ncbi:hypothetical protein [Amycolatopsis sp. Hca4]|uniref:hypothetical protein n=1 Tax=Amycolatopsis sp. Hca4 TaxID=2742131 RepID=UPI00158FA504|nr:hypothetical protein [Amycolatopsis sp. Hca4]QKV80676.1 hypothetical protein HUT10_48040 [Amycolatopsis sp. Hca4]